MFRGQKYITHGIEEDIPKELQIYLWNLILEMKVKKVDYLQVLKIKLDKNDGKKGLIIVHSQEVPPYKQEHFYETDFRITAKIFVIDDGAHSTMLLAEEY
jgi:hypothetical protein